MQYLPRCCMLGEYPETSSRLKIQSQCTCEHCWDQLIQFCGNNKQVVKGVHCQCNVNTTGTSLYTNEQWLLLLKDKKKLFTVNVLEIQYFTTSASLNTNEQWIILLKYKKKSFTVNLLEIQYFTTDKAGTLTSSGQRILEDRELSYTVNVM